MYWKVAYIMYLSNEELFIVGCLLFTVSMVLLYFLQVYTETENHNKRLTVMLQCAEIHTGLPFYSSVPPDVNTFEKHKHYYNKLQERLYSSMGS